MHCTPSVITFAFISLSFITPILGGRPAVPEIWQKRRLEAKRDSAEKHARRDQICYTDDYLAQLISYSADFTSFCSAFITATDNTATVPTTTTTTISEIYTTEVPSGASAATVPSSTVTVTQTAMLRKRQASGTGPITATPVVATAPGALMSSIESACLTPTGLNLLLINSYSSACTCFLTPNVDTIFVTVTTTRTISGDDRLAQITETLTSGISTVTETLVPEGPSMSNTYVASNSAGMGPTNIGPTFPAGNDSGGSVTSSSLAIPTGAPLPNCPAQNGSIYNSLGGQQYLILCETNFPGPSTEGLVAPSLHTCLDNCALVTLGYSEDECYAASYNAFAAPGKQNCFFKGLFNSRASQYDPGYMSGLLLNTTTNGTASFTGVFPSDTGIISANGGIFPSGTAVIPTAPVDTSNPRAGASGSGSGVLPSGTGAIPSGSGIVGSGTAVVPSGSGSIPTAPSDTRIPRTGMYPSGTGVMPSGMGFIPSGTGVMPSGSGIVPSGTGALPSGTGPASCSTTVSTTITVAEMTITTATVVSTTVTVAETTITAAFATTTVVTMPHTFEIITQISTLTV